MGNIFSLAKEMPLAATEYRVAFPFKWAAEGFAMVEQEMVPFLNSKGEEVKNDEGKAVERPRFKAEDVELWLTVSAIPPQQLAEARTNVKIDCDKAKVATDGAYASELKTAQKARLIIEHVEGWEHNPKDGEPQEFNREVLAHLVEQVKKHLGSEAFNTMLDLSLTWAVLEETQTAITARQDELARKNGHYPTSGKASESLAFDV